MDLAGVGPSSETYAGRINKPCATLDLYLRAMKYGGFCSGRSEGVEREQFQESVGELSKVSKLNLVPRGLVLPFRLSPFSRTASPSSNLQVQAGQCMALVLPIG